VFEKLSKEKQMKVVNAAFISFGRGGYGKTSVADIASSARVSKASLFQYFGTKKEMYFYMFRRACDVIIAEVGEGPPDFFDCMRVSTRMKLRVVARHPALFEFLDSIAAESDARLIAELRQLDADAMNLAMRRLFINVNWEKFKPNIPKAMALNMLNWVSEGFIKANTGKSADEVLRELDRYYDVLRAALYKREYV
jgi:AcrR family transcriptional regulator